MAHTKAIGAGKYGKDSRPKYLGVKLSGGQKARVGNIIIRQRGTKVVPGTGARLGKDDTIYAVRNGQIKFTTKRMLKFNGHRRLVKIVSVIYNEKTLKG
ncbi:MAG: large subunit ribosomal protein L27 [Parcubacteria group bacterium Gr01-1014_44]|nr:MAG: large subunit ribosomal protein L27 [Parcubacteria group bacterium Gr01-1014_44]